MQILAYAILAMFVLLLLIPSRFGYRVQPEYDFGHVVVWLRLSYVVAGLVLAAWVIYP